MGSEQYKDIFETFEDKTVQMGPRKKIRLFEDMRNYEEAVDPSGMVSKTRQRPGSNYAAHKNQQRMRLVSPPPNTNVNIKLEYLSRQEQMNKTVTDRRAQNTLGDRTQDDVIVRLPPPEHIQQIV